MSEYTPSSEFQSPSTDDGWLREVGFEPGFVTHSTAHFGVEDIAAAMFVGVTYTHPRFLPVTLAPGLKVRIRISRLDRLDVIGNCKQTTYPDWYLEGEAYDGDLGSLGYHLRVLVACGGDISPEPEYTWTQVIQNGENHENEIRIVNIPG